MASIALIAIGCIDCLAYGTSFMRAMFCLKIKLDVFFSARKAADERCPHESKILTGDDRFAFHGSFASHAVLVSTNQKNKDNKQY